MRRSHILFNIFLLFVLFLFLSFNQSAAGIQLKVGQPASGRGPSTVTGSRDVAWLQEADLSGHLGSSEVIGAYGFETEIANDFLLGMTGVITSIGWWGGYYNGFETPIASGFNIRFYLDDGCRPGFLVAEIIILNSCGEELIDAEYPDRFQYYTEIPPFAVQAATRHWLRIQMADHTFPPQWGRLDAMNHEECESVFKSDYLSYPDWIPCAEVFGVPYDASFALYTGQGEGEACCLDYGFCVYATPETCLDLGGSPFGSGSVCDPNPCPQPELEACCFPDGSCQMLLESTCLETGGTSHGVGSDCDPNPCPPAEACCHMDGHCEFLLPDLCLNQEGDPQGDGTVCDPNPCSMGACCYTDYNGVHCVEVSELGCTEWYAGDYLGDGIFCDPNPCGPSAIDEAEVVPVHATISPNPFSLNCRISFWLQTASPVSVEVFEFSGRVVRRLVIALQSAGNHFVTWDGRDDQGRGLATGSYIVRVSTSKGTKNLRVALLR